MVSRGLADPRRRDPGQLNLDPVISKQLQTWADADPPSQSQQALPSSTVMWIATQYTAGTIKRMHMVAHLIVIAFFFLLRVGEYTPSTGKRRTVPLRKKDITLWAGPNAIPNDAPLEVMKTATAVTVHLENQKNGHKNAILHHYRSGVLTFDPVLSAAFLLNEIRHKPVSTPLGTFTDNHGTQQQVLSADIRTAVRIGAIGDNRVASGYTLSRIGSHSLRSGGAVHLKLAGYDDDMVKKLGRWSSNTYLRYIQTQVGQLTRGVATKMATILRFHYVGG